MLTDDIRNHTEASEHLSHARRLIFAHIREHGSTELLYEALGELNGAHWKIGPDFREVIKRWSDDDCVHAFHMLGASAAAEVILGQRVLKDFLTEGPFASISAHVPIEYHKAVVAFVGYCRNELGLFTNHSFSYRWRGPRRHKYAHHTLKADAVAFSVYCYENTPE